MSGPAQADVNPDPARQTFAVSKGEQQLLLFLRSLKNEGKRLELVFEFDNCRLKLNKVIELRQAEFA